MSPVLSSRFAEGLLNATAVSMSAGISVDVGSIRQFDFEHSQLTSNIGLRASLAKQRMQKQSEKNGHSEKNRNWS